MRRLHHRTANIIFGIGLLLLILMQFWFPILTSGNPTDTRSTSTKGKKAFFLLMESQDFDIYRADDNLNMTLQTLGPSETYAMLGPGRLPSTFQWEQILEWVADGGTLLVAAPWQEPQLTIPEVGITIKPNALSPSIESAVPDEVEETSSADDEEEEEEETEYRFFKSFDSAIYESDKIAWAKGGVIELEGKAERTYKGLVRCESVLQAVEVPHYRGRIIALANDAIFSNQSMMNPDNAVFAVRLMEYSLSEGNYYDAITVEEWLSTTAVPKVVGLILAPPFRNLTLLVFGILWIFAWWKWFRFGPYLPEPESGRLNIVSHTDTVGTMYYQERLGRYALEGYWKQLQKELNWSPHRQQQSRVISRLARRAQRDEAEIKDLLNRTLDGIDNPNLQRTDAAHLIRELAKLRAAVFV